MSELHYEGQLQADDFAAILRLTGVYRRHAKLCASGMALLLAGSATVAVYGGAFSDLWMPLVGFAMIPGMYLAYLVVNHFKLKRGDCRHLMKGDGRVQGVVLDDGVKDTAGDKPRFRNWGGYVGHRMTADVMLLHTDPSHATILARRMFARPEDWNTLVERVRERVPAM